MAVSSAKVAETRAWPACILASGSWFCGIRHISGSTLGDFITVQQSTSR